MLQECSRFDSLEHRKLERVLLNIKQNCNYNFIIETYGDLCTNSYFARLKGQSYGTMVQMQHSNRFIACITGLLYSERTGKYYYHHL